MATPESMVFVTILAFMIMPALCLWIGFRMRNTEYSKLGKFLRILGYLTLFPVIVSVVLFLIFKNL